MNKPKPDVFEIDKHDDLMVIRPVSNLSDHLLDALKTQVDSLLGEMKDQAIQNVIVDLCNTSYFGTDFIAVLLKIWKRLNPRSGKLSICNASPQEKEVFEICELDRLWPICDSLDDAIQKMRA